MFLYDGTIINFTFNYIGEKNKCILLLHGYGADSKSFDFYYKKFKDNYNILKEENNSLKEENQKLNDKINIITKTVE